MTSIAFGESLRGKISSHLEYTHSDISAVVPDLEIEELNHGSFRLMIATDAGSFVVRDFSLIFAHGKVVGKGLWDESQFTIVGRYNTSSSSKLLMAATLRKITEAGHSTSPPSPNSHDEMSDCTELRCEFTMGVKVGLEVVNAFCGEWYNLTDGKLKEGSMRLWPTPEPERLGGYHIFTITTPTCGIEHSGTYTQWHGVGAEIRRVGEPANSLGMRPGDVIKAINWARLPIHKKSSEVSASIKAASRPLTLLVWRDTQDVPLAVLSLETMAPIDEATQLTMATTARIKESFQSMEHISKDLKRDMMDEIKKKKMDLELRRQSMQKNSREDVDCV